jgi:hypothetical protein
MDLRGSASTAVRPQQPPERDMPLLVKVYAASEEGPGREKTGAALTGCGAARHTPIHLRNRALGCNNTVGNGMQCDRAKSSLLMTRG